MRCQYCNAEVPCDRTICPNNDCYRPIKPLPIPPGGKIQFGGYGWYVLEKQERKMLIISEYVIKKRVFHSYECEITEEVVKYLGDSGQLKNRNINSGCDWCKDEFFPWIDDQYNINRRAADDSGMIVSWRLRSSGANGRLVAFVMGNCGDEFEHGGFNVSGGGGDIQNGHFIFNSSDVLDVMKSTNGVRPSLWLRTE